MQISERRPDKRVVSMSPYTRTFVVSRGKYSATFETLATITQSATGSLSGVNPNMHFLLHTSKWGAYIKHIPREGAPKERVGES